MNEEQYSDVDNELVDLQAQIGLVIAAVTGNGEKSSDDMDECETVIYAAMQECYSAYQRADAALRGFSPSAKSEG